MPINLFGKAAFAGFAIMVAQSASAAVYDFKAAGNAGGGIGESIFSTFATSSFAGFTGPGLGITATATDNDPNQYVYFDNGNAGIGVCKDPKAGASIGTFTNGSTNFCDPGSDDGFTALLETLTFTATDTAVVIQSIWLNANHDQAGVRDASYEINGVTYTTADMIDDLLSGSGDDVRIDLGFVLNVGDSFSLTAVRGSPDSYLSGIALTPVPLPAAGLLLLGALGGLGAIGRRRRKVA